MPETALPMLRALAAASAGAAIVFRSARRSVAYGLSVAALGAVAVATFAFHADLHTSGAPLLPIADILSPRFLPATHGTALLTLALFAGTAFVAALGGREASLGLAEALDTKAHANLPLLLGRVLALAALAWWPVAVVVIGAQALGVAGWGEPMVGAALAAYALADALPATLLWCAMLSTIAARGHGNWLAPAVGAALLAAYHWALSTAPAQLLPAISLNSAHGAFSQHLPADVVWPRRAATLAAAFGLVCVAAALARRADGHRRTLAGAGAALVLAGLAGVAGSVWIAGLEAKRRDVWLRAQRGVDVDKAAAFHIEHLEGRVELAPARGLAAALRVRLARQAGARPAAARLSLNPALGIERLAVNGRPAAHTHRHGLLIVELSAEMRAATTLELTLRYAGVPDAAFGYLDSGFDWRREAHGAWAFLGREASIFTPRLVALMPAARWLPAVGANIAGRPPDFFTLDLAVAAPDHWRVAGPGGLPVATGSGGWRFQPSAPVSAAGLIAAPFSERTGRAGDVPVSFLFAAGADAAHLASFAGALADGAATLLADAKAAGLPYPFEGLTFVAVPPQLRAYAGGWRMGTVNTLPGVVLLRDGCLAAGRGDEEDAASATRWGGGGVASNLAAGLGGDMDAGTRSAAWQRCLRWNGTGGSAHAALARHAFATLASARGEGALAVNMLLDALVRRLLAPGARDFSANDLLGATTLRALILTIAEQAVGAMMTAPSAVTALPEAPPELWRATRQLRLREVSAASGDARALAALRHKVDGAAKVVFDVLGRRGTAAVLADLRAAFAGGAFPPRALFDQVAAADANLARFLRHWLNHRSLPGLRVSNADVRRLPDDNRGQARWQTTVHVRNTEDAPGYARVQVGAEAGLGFNAWNASDPVFVPGRSAVEVGVVGRINPTRLFVESYLSLNQGPVHVGLAHELNRTQRPAFAAARPSAWRGPSPESLVVDDLDSGFRVLTAPGAPARAAFAAAPNPPMPAHSSATDEHVFSLWRGTLPSSAQWLVGAISGLRQIADDGPAGWTRQSNATAWGRYRRTVARATAGDDAFQVAFVTELPRPGRWRLDYHLPDTAFKPPPGTDGGDAAFRLDLTDADDQGDYDITVLHHGAVREAHSVPFDGALGLPGWNPLGAFDLPAGEVAVVVSDAGGGKAVFADAVRWRRADRQPAK